MKINPAQPTTPDPKKRYLFICPRKSGKATAFAKLLEEEKRKK